MPLREVWCEIPEFPDYAISSLGRVKNQNSTYIKAQTPNQQGILSVILVRDGEKYRRSVAVLVASLFLDPPPRVGFDTPIHLNCDRTDCRAANLAWRPRWFAVQYHQQFNYPVPHGYRGRIRNATRAQTFPSLTAAAQHHGLLMRDILRGAQQGTAVAPIYEYFQMVR